ncbi:helix-turn-helix domain-containing protein [Nesterenkonia sp. CF4.4]|uniref:helix-turn-helix domain-containing protein n=1 Tax=Nesterenkonia sp. CF4.4 TaxID=3373079 RepID=UPI003EE743EA
MTESAFEKYSRAGRRGGLHNTPRQQQARSLGAPASLRVRAQKADDRAVSVQALAASGKTRAEIGELLGISRSTVHRMLLRSVGS